jgi:hypothetical protein
MEERDEMRMKNFVVVVVVVVVAVVVVVVVVVVGSGCSGKLDDEEEQRDAAHNRDARQDVMSSRSRMQVCPSSHWSTPRPASFTRSIRISPNRRLKSLSSSQPSLATRSLLA